jgi:hypothetical protein
MISDLNFLTQRGTKTRSGHSDEALERGRRH